MHQVPRVVLGNIVINTLAYVFLWGIKCGRMAVWVSSGISVRMMRFPVTIMTSVSSQPRLNAKYNNRHSSVVYFYKFFVKGTKQSPLVSVC